MTFNVGGYITMTRYIWVFTVIVVIQLSAIPSSAEQQTTNPYKVHAERLKQTFEPALFTFHPDIQKHYAVRLYRMTGDNRYIYPIIFNLFVFLKKLHYDEQ